MIVKSVGVLSVGKVLGCLYALMGLLIGGIFTLISLAGAAAMNAAGGRGGGPEMMIFGVGAIVFVPIFYGLIGFIGGMIAALLYNLIAATIGGIEIELQRERGDRRDRDEW